MDEEEEVLHGGVATAGAVVRIGDEVLRPSNPHSASIHEALVALHAVGFEGASKPIGIDADGRERLEFIKGDVPVSPFPEWAQADEALASVARLMKRLHDASTAIDLTHGTWNKDLADPRGGSVLCHNDVCLENIVFRSGQAVALIDFDFAAPGRRVFDLASFARMCVPIDDDINAQRLGWAANNRPARLRVIADAYGLGSEDRLALLHVLDRSIQLGGEFVRRRVEAGEPGFVKMWEEMGGSERFDRRRRWWATQKVHHERAMSAEA